MFAALVAIALHPDVRAALSTFVEWCHAQGPLGYLYFAALYVVATVALFPGTPMILAGGFVFGFAALPLVIVCATIGAGIAFLLGRHVARDRAALAASRRPMIAAIMNAIAQDGWRIVLLTRVSPVAPFTVQNYLFGLTALRFWPYLAATFFGVMPGSILYIYLGSVGQMATSASADGSEAVWRWLFFVLGIAVTVWLTWWVGVKAKAQLDAAVARADQSADDVESEVAAPRDARTR